MRIRLSAISAALVCHFFVAQTDASVTVTSRLTHLEMHLTATDTSGTNRYDFSDTVTTLDPYDTNIHEDVVSPNGTGNHQAVVEAEVSQKLTFAPHAEVPGEFGFDLEGGGGIYPTFALGNAYWTGAIASEFQLGFLLDEPYELRGDINAWPNTAALSLNGPGGLVFSYSPLPNQIGIGVEVVLPPGAYTFSASAYGSDNDGPSAGGGYAAHLDAIPISAIPEPGCVSAVAFGMAGFASWRRRYR
jgi:hypothetical protein